MNIKNKTILVTGGSTGIGRAIATAFANEGSNVIINYRSKKAEAEKLLEELKDTGGKHIIVGADAGKEDEVKAMFQEIKNHFDSIDILVNNAGDAKSVDLLNDPLEKWEYQLNNNFLSAVINSKEFINFSQNKDLRKIINVSSIWSFGDKTSKRYAGYGASKAAVNSFTQTMAKNFAPNILVNAIAPGYVITPHWGEMTPEDEKEHADQQLIERFIRPEEIADGAIFLAKNDSMTGTILLMDGGIGLKTV